MSALDYEIRGSGPICTVANVAGAVGYGDVTILIKDVIESGASERFVGMGAMINGEIVRVTAINEGSIGVARGCADTIPLQHAVNSQVWFFDGSVGRDSREYLAGETLGVKVLMKTTRQTMEISTSPPNTLVMEGRFARPYAPGRVRVNGQPWFAEHAALAVQNSELVVTWAHRDRVTQLDQLIGHEDTDIGPELGVSYEIEVYDWNNVLVRTESLVDVAGITPNTWTYTLSQAISDFTIAPGSTGIVEGYILLKTKRLAFESWRHYHIDIKINPVVPGWGKAWGWSWN